MGTDLYHEFAKKLHQIKEKIQQKLQKVTIHEKNDLNDSNDGLGLWFYKLFFHFYQVSVNYCISFTCKLLNIEKSSFGFDTGLPPCQDKRHTKRCESKSAKFPNYDQSIFPRNSQL